MKAGNHRNFPAEKWGSPRWNADCPLHQNVVCALSVSLEHTMTGRPGSICILIRRCLYVRTYY